MATHHTRDPPRSPHRLSSSYSSSDSNQSPRGSLFDPTDFSSHSLRLASSHATARPALPFRQPSTASSTHPDMHHPHRRVPRASTLHRVASGIRRLAFSDTTPDDWSVFSEAMAHEVVQTPPAAAPPIRDPLTLSMPAPGGGVGEMTGQWTHSPVSDMHHDEHFPPTVVEDEEEEERLGSNDDDDGSAGRHATHTNAVDSDTEPPSASLKDTRQQDSKPTSGGAWYSLSSRVPTLPTLYRNILKCSLAYFLGSLFTYYKPLSRFIVELTQDGPGEKYPSAAGHMVATV